MSKQKRTENVIKTEKDFQVRVDQWSEEDKAAELAKKNNNFFMLFKQNGSPAVRKMIRLNGIAAELFLFIAENMDKSNGLIGSGKAFASALNTSEASISRALKLLNDEGYIARFKSGGSNVIVANPDLVWNSWATGKDACLFGNAKVLISKSEQDANLVRKFAHLIPKVDQTNEEEVKRLKNLHRRLPNLDPTNNNSEDSEPPQNPET